jgi:hypothetical protein
MFCLHHQGDSIANVRRTMAVDITTHKCINVITYGTHSDLATANDDRTTNKTTLFIMQTIRCTRRYVCNHASPPEKKISQKREGLEKLIRTF